MLLFDEMRGWTDEEMEFDYARFDPRAWSIATIFRCKIIFVCEGLERFTFIVDVREILLPITIGRVLDNKR